MEVRTETTETEVRRGDPGMDGDPRSVVQLVKELRDEMSDLVRQEVILAKTEMSEKVSRVLRNVAYLAVGGAILHASFIILLIAGSAGAYVGLVAADMSHFTAGWLGPLLVGLIVVIIGYAFLQKAISTLKNESLIPEETVASLKRTKNWAQEKAS
jgi:hypothetical protein